MAHIHGVYDTDTHFILNSVTKELSVSEGYEKVKVIQHDHNSERFTFQLDRYIEGHDMSTCNKVEVHYLNVDAKTKEESVGLYSVDDLQVSPEDESVVLCSWLISNNATKYVGSLYFVVRFECNDGSINYALNTLIYEGILVGKGIYNSEFIATEYVDVLERWKKELVDAGGLSDEEIAKAVASYLENHPIETSSKAKISEVTLYADNWVSDGNLHSQIVTIEGVTANSQIDLTPSGEQLKIFHEKDLTLTTKNIDGVVTVYAIGQKPTNDYTIQVTIMEVEYE